MGEDEYDLSDGNRATLELTSHVNSAGYIVAQMVDNAVLQLNNDVTLTNQKVVPKALRDLMIFLFCSVSF